MSEWKGTSAGFNTLPVLIQVFAFVFLFVFAFLFVFVFAFVFAFVYTHYTQTLFLLLGLALL